MKLALTASVAGPSMFVSMSMDKAILCGLSPGGLCGQVSGCAATANVKPCLHNITLSALTGG